MLWLGRKGKGWEDEGKERRRGYEEQGTPREEEEKAKKYIEELIKNKLISAEGQVKSSERKILREIEQRAIDLSIEKVKVSFSKSLSGSDYERHFYSSMRSVEKGLKQVYS